MNNTPRALPKLDFNITNRCNFRCIHCCFQSGEIMPEEFSVEKITTVLQEFKNLGGQRIDITGGEPLTRPDLEEIISVAKKLELKIELVTNGSLLTATKLKKFKTLGVDGVAISMDGSCHEIYRKIRPITKTTYDRIIENIKTCVKLGFYTKINTVVFKSNFKDLISINDRCLEWGVQEQGFYYFTPVGRGASSPGEVVDPMLWLQLVRTQLAPRQNRIKLSIETPLLENILGGKTNTACYLENPWHLQILPDGNVYPCAIMAFYHRPCGNLNLQTLTEIWTDPKLWNGHYYKQNVLPLFKKFGGCVCFNDNFKKQIDSGKFKFACLMCKLKTENFIL